MAKIVLGATGSVAAIRTPQLFANLIAMGHEVRVIATEPALHFFKPDELGPPAPGGGPVYRDADEWPSGGWRRDDQVLHIEFRRWADLLVLAPLDANTLGKVALGLCDNFLTCLVRAWDFRKFVVLCPAMNTTMWESPATRRHLNLLLEDRGDGRHDLRAPLDRAAEQFAIHAPGILLVPPQSKRLACGDVGVGAMAEVVDIAEAVRAWAEVSRGDAETAER